MKKGNKPKMPEIIETLQPLVEEKNFSWNDFADTWDIIIKGDKVQVVASIKDINAVSETCTKKQMAVAHNITVDWTAEDQAIVEMIESQFLDGIMTWANYKTAWIVRYDHETHKIVTNVVRPKTQLDVTEEMIDRKLKEAMENSKKVADETNNAFVSRPMTPEEIEIFTKKTKTSRKNNK